MMSQKEEPNEPGSQSYQDNAADDPANYYTSVVVWRRWGNRAGGCGLDART